MIQLLESFNNEGLLAQPLVVLSSKNESWGPKFWPVARLRDRLECKHMLSPEHEAPLRDGKGERAETGTGKGRKERKCSLNLVLEQTIFCERPLTLPIFSDIFMIHLNLVIRQNK